MGAAPVPCHILLGPNIILSTLLSNTLNPCSSLNMKDQVSYLYKKRIKLYSVYFILRVFRQQTGRQKIQNCMVASIPRI
jgi:hypothetical protein